MDVIPTGSKTLHQSWPRGGGYERVIRQGWWSLISYPEQESYLLAGDTVSVFKVPTTRQVIINIAISIIILILFTSLKNDNRDSSSLPLPPHPKLRHNHNFVLRITVEFHLTGTFLYPPPPVVVSIGKWCYDWGWCLLPIDAMWVTDWKKWKV